MEKMLVIFGNFTFDHFVEEELKLFTEKTKRKVLLHSIDKVVECDNQEEVDKLVDEIGDTFDSWVVPHEFNGELVYEPEPKRKDFKNLVKSN